MTRRFLAGLIALPLMASTAQALPPQAFQYLGEDLTTIRKNLETMGYVVLSIGEDETGFEAEIQDGTAIYDVSVSPVDGLVTNVELDFDEDGDA